MAQATNPWPRIIIDAWLLGLEMSAVIGLRWMKLAAGGPAAATEANRMVAEKVAAGLELQAKVMTAAAPTPAGLSRKLVRHYGTKVRANRRRLAKTPRS